MKNANTLKNANMLKNENILKNANILKKCKCFEKQKHFEKHKHFEKCKHFEGPFPVSGSGEVSLRPKSAGTMRGQLRQSTALENPAGDFTPHALSYISDPAMQVIFITLLIRSQLKVAILHPLILIQRSLWRNDMETMDFYSPYKISPQIFQNLN